MNEAQDSSVNLFRRIQAPKLNKERSSEFLLRTLEFEAAVQANPGINAISWASCFDTIFFVLYEIPRDFGFTLAHHFTPSRITALRIERGPLRMKPYFTQKFHEIPPSLRASSERYHRGRSS